MTISNVTSSTPAATSQLPRQAKTDKQPAAAPHVSTVVSISNEARKLDSAKQAVHVSAATKSEQKPETASPAPKQAVAQQQTPQPDVAKNSAPATAKPAPQIQAPPPKPTAPHEQATTPVETQASASAAAPAPQTTAPPPKQTSATQQVHNPVEAKHTERAAAAANSTEQAQAPAQPNQTHEVTGIKFMAGESKNGHVNTYA